MAFFLDYLDNTISSRRGAARSSTPFPVLAVIPRHAGHDGPRAAPAAQTGAAPADSDRSGHPQRRPGRDVARPIRELRTSILLSNPGSPPRQIMITSAVPEEGKTATAINLAIVLAQLGRRVLLVDTDLRRPRLHKAFGVDNRRGVSTYLSGLEDEPAALVVPTGIENLDLLPSGPIPPNPSELLNSHDVRRDGPAADRRGLRPRRLRLAAGAVGRPIP